MRGLVRHRHRRRTETREEQGCPRGDGNHADDGDDSDRKRGPERVRGRVVTLLYIYININSDPPSAASPIDGSLDVMQHDRRQVSYFARRWNATVDRKGQICAVVAPSDQWTKDRGGAARGGLLSHAQETVPFATGADATCTVVVGKANDEPAPSTTSMNWSSTSWRICWN